MAEVFGFDEAIANAQSLSDSIDEDIILELSRIGDILCNHARTITPGHDTGGYDDQTGNLRSSIAFRIYKYGQVVKEGGFARVGGMIGNGDEGTYSAQAAFDYIPANTEGWCLVVVAGMKYATYVEAKGYNVLHLTRIEMEALIHSLQERLAQ